MRVFHSKLTLSQGEFESMREDWKALGDPSTLCFLDIETTGFSRRYDSVYLIGLLYYEEGAFQTIQFLAGAVREEPEILRAFAERIGRFVALVTYNGDMFDLPFLCERARLLRVEGVDRALSKERLLSIDLMKEYRPYKAFFGWPDMKLKTLEAQMGVHRADIFSGGQLIEVFHEYSRTDDARLEKTLLLHNYEDIMHLQKLLLPKRHLTLLKEGFPLGLHLKGHRLLVEWSHPFPMSLQTKLPLYKKEEVFAVYTFESGSPVFSIALPKGPKALKYFLPDHQDYLYIPKENAIVHRSLAYELPSGETKKAKAEQCYVTADLFGEEDQFLAAFPYEEGKCRLYRESYRSKVCYCRQSELQSMAEGLSQAEAKRFLAPYLHPIGPLQST